MITLPDAVVQTRNQLLAGCAGGQPEQLHLRNLIATMFDEAAITSGATPISTYGALGDGINDDTPAFKTAAATGKLISLKADCRYRLTERVDFLFGGGLIGPRSAIIVPDPAAFNNTSTDVGLRYGKNAVVFRAAGEITAPYTPLDSITFRGFTIDGGSVDGRITTTMLLRNITNVDVSDIEIKNCCGTGIGAMSIGGGRISWCYIHDFWQDSLAAEFSGILCDGDLINNIVSTNVEISGNIICNMLFGPNAYASANYQPNGIKCTERLSTGYRIIGNSVDGAGQGIDFYGSNSVIAHNVLVHCLIYALKLIHGASQNELYGNIIDHFGYGGIALDGDTTYNTSYNSIHDNTVVNGGDDSWPVDEDGVHFAEGDIVALGVDTGCIVTHLSPGAGKNTLNVIHHNIAIPGPDCLFAYIRKGDSSQTNFWLDNYGVAGSLAVTLATTGEFGPYTLISTDPPSFILTSPGVSTIPLSIANRSNVAGTEAVFDITATNNLPGVRSCQVVAVNRAGSTANDMDLRTQNGSAPTTRLTIKADGKIIIAALPTSASGLTTGTLWNNSGVVNVA